MLVFGVSQCVVYVFIKDKGFALFGQVFGSYTGVWALHTDMYSNPRVQN